MKIKLLPTSAVHPYPNNPRVNHDAVDDVAASIRQFGFRQPIVVDRDMVVVVGHTRLAAAIKLGIDKIPVHVADDITPTQARQYRLADNRAHERSKWDLDLLADELRDLGDDAHDIGWDEKELAFMLRVPQPTESSGRDVDENVANAVASATCPSCGCVFPLGGGK